MHEDSFEPFQKVLVRDSDRDNWRCGFFSHMRERMAFKYVATSDVWEQCIPYEGNESLVGTSDSPTPPEPEFRFGDHVEVSSDGAFWLKAIYCRKSYDPTKPHSVVVENSTEVMLWEHCRKADW